MPYYDSAMNARTAVTGGGFFAAIVDFAARKPLQTLAIVLGAHVVVWTLLPLLTSANLELDLAEDLALGKEWQLGYWKHPPLPWWLADLAYRITGHVGVVYVLGPLSVAACFLGVYLLSRDIVGPVQAFVATLSLAGIHFYNYSAVKFAHDQMQLPFWAFTGLFLYRALVHGRLVYWALAGAAMALCFWSKYAAFALAVSIALFMLIDPVARRSFRTAGPYVMAVAFAIVIAPNAWWLVDSDFLPMRYVTDRARIATVWYQYITYPGLWLLSQAFFIFPTLILLGLVLFPRRPAADPQPWVDPFSRRYATMLGLGPFAVVATIATVTSRAPVALWGYPLWSFLPLAALVWFGPVADMQRKQFFVAGFLFLFLLGPAVWMSAWVAEPYVRTRPKATQFPGQTLANRITDAWREKTGTPLTYVAGTEFTANNVAVYSPDRPHVIVHGRPQISPWIDLDDVRKRGMVVVWEVGLPAAYVDEWRATFGAQGDPIIIELPRQHAGVPTRIAYWLIPPRN